MGVNGKPRISMKNISFRVGASRLHSDLVPSIHENMDEIFQLNYRESDDGERECSGPWRLRVDGKMSLNGIPQRSIDVSRG